MMRQPPIRPEVRAFKPYTAGRSIESVRRTYGLERVIKLASNENPLGASPLAQRAVRDHADAIFRYPAAGNPDLCAAIAAHHGVDAARVVVGNGSDELIDLLLRIMADPARHEVVAFAPCFGIYSTQTALCGITLRQTPLNKDFSFPWEHLLGNVDGRTALVFVTTPDNPSGFCPPVEDLEVLARALPSTCLLVVDEAYMDFCGDEAAHSLLPRLDEFPNVAVLRTFSKSRGLAGLRLGYGVFPLEIADYLRRTRLPFSVNIAAEAAALAALEDTVFYAETLRVVAEGRDRIRDGLEALGCTVYPSRANFLMFGLPRGKDTPEETGAVVQALLERGIIIRPLDSYNLPNRMRVSVGTAEENGCFLKALGDILNTRGRA